MKFNAVIFAFSLWNMASGQNHCKPKNCYDLKCLGLSKGIDGPHTIYPERPNPNSFLEVSCDQEARGGGWIMYQRRVDGTLNFTKTYAESKIMFGKHGGSMTELWLGNENVYQLLQSFGGRKVTLRVEVDAFDGDSGWIEATDFTMGGVGKDYRLYWANCTGSTIAMANSWTYHKEHSFKTYDRTAGFPQCLIDFKGGWWYAQRTCGMVYLNGDYLDKVNPGIYFEGFKREGLRQSRMMFRTTSVVAACNNPCRNGGTCLHVADPIGRLCVCTFEFCGPECKLANPCKNNGTCEYDKTTTNTTCNCSAGFSGPLCQDAAPTMLPSTPTTPTSIMPIVGGILLLLILTGLGIAAFVIYKRRQKQREEEEAANRGIPFVDFLTDQGYQDYMLGLFGF